MTDLTAKQLLDREDLLTLDEANIIATDVDNGMDSLKWIDSKLDAINVTTDEAKLFAIVRGLLLARIKDQENI